MVRGKLASIFLERMLVGLNYLSNWCDEANLMVKEEVEKFEQSNDEKSNHWIF
jgi:hypothetical protein